jgi:hypothetical protein
MPDGVSGFGAFGATENCISAAEAVNMLLPLFKAALAQAKVPSDWPGIGGQSLAGIPDNILRNVLTGGVKELAAASTKGGDAIKTAIKNIAKKVVVELPGAREVLGGLSFIVGGDPIDKLATLVVDKIGGFDAIDICDDKPVLMEAILAQPPQLISLSAAQRAAISKQVGQNYIGSQATAAERAKYSPNLRAIMPAGTTTGAGAVAGNKTLLLGAAALAALFLLR